MKIDREYFSRLWLLFWTFAKIAALVVGGGLAMLPVIEETFVNKKKLLTNEEVLALEKTTSGAKEVMDTDGKIAWKTTDASGNVYVGLFNTTDEETEVSCEFALLGLTGEKKVRDLWAKEDIGVAKDSIAAVIPAHGAKLYKLS